MQEGPKVGCLTVAGCTFDCNRPFSALLYLVRSREVRYCRRGKRYQNCMPLLEIGAIGIVTVGREFYFSST